MAQPLRFLFQPRQPVGRLTPAGQIDPQGMKGRIVFWDRRTTADWKADCQYDIYRYQLFCPRSKEVCFLIVDQAVEVPVHTVPLRPVAPSPKSRNQSGTRQGVPPEWNGYVFSDEQRHELATTGELAKPIWVANCHPTRPGRQADLPFVAYSQVNHQYVAINARQLALPALVHQFALNAEQRRMLRARERVRIDGMIDDRGNRFTGELRYSALHNRVVVGSLSEPTDTSAGSTSGSVTTGSPSPSMSVGDVTPEQIHQLKEIWGSSVPSSRRQKR